jgi:hypothetical protein
MDNLMDNLKEEVWTFPSPVEGESDIVWHFENSVPVSIRVGKMTVPASSPLLRLFNMPVSQQGIAFPPAFAFDPASGIPLSKISTNVLITSFPNLSPTGFSTLPTGSRYDAGKKTRLMNIPLGAQCLFAAGTPAHHFCITNAGDLYFSPNRDTWLLIERLARPSGNPASFGVASFRNGFATILSDTALICEFIDGLPQITKQTLKLNDGGIFCAAPSLIERDCIVFPIKRQDQISLAIYDPNSRQWLDEIPAKGPPIDCGEGFPAAIQNSSLTPDVFWIGKNGYLTLTSEHGTRLAETYMLPSEVTTVTGVPALRDERDTIHVLARTADHYCYVSLQPQSATFVLGGPHIAAGRARYIGRDFFPSLLDDDVTTFQIEAGTGKLLLPLAFTTNAKGRTDGGLILLVDGIQDIDALFSKPENNWFHGNLYWHNGSQLHPLQISLRFRSRFDIMLLLDDDALIVGSSMTNDFFRLEQ